MPLAWAGIASADVFSLPTGQTSLVMLSVGNTGNEADPTTGFGSVAYSCSIGGFDVTATQYTAFLNAVASTDTYGLYSPGMAMSRFASCGISQTATPTGFSYATSNNGNFLVNYVTWGDAARFCNRLANNQPIAAEGNSTTETGSYTLNGAVSTPALQAITRNPNADYVIPTENEWYKAAYYNPIASTYYIFPTQSNIYPSNALSSSGTDNANYHNNDYHVYTDPVNYLTAVGAFASSPSFYGTYDQGGDVYQWNESIYSDSYHGIRGGAFENSA